MEKKPVAKDVPQIDEGIRLVRNITFSKAVANYDADLSATTTGEWITAEIRGFLSRTDGVAKKLVVVLEINTV